MIEAFNRSSLFTDICNGSTYIYIYIHFAQNGRGFIWQLYIDKVVESSDSINKLLLLYKVISDDSQIWQKKHRTNSVLLCSAASLVIFFLPVIS